MKQHAISGLKKKLLIVELPEDGSILRIKKGTLTVETENENLDTVDYLLLDNCSLIGKLTDITEEQFFELMNSSFYKDVDNLFPGKMLYKNYLNNLWFNTAKESFFSKMEVEGICFENKLGEFPTKENTGLEYGMEYISKVASWEEAQEEVWDKDRTWVFEVI